jgi:hypothetical protein
VSSQESLEKDLARGEKILQKIVKEAEDALKSVRLEKGDRERLQRKTQEAAERARLDDERLGDAREACEECALMVAHGLYGLESVEVKAAMTQARELLAVAELEVGRRSGVDVSSTEAMEEGLATMRQLCEQAVETSQAAVRVVGAEQQRLEISQRERLQHERELRVAMRNGEFAEAVGLLDEAKGVLQRSIFSAELQAQADVIAGVVESEATIKESDALLARPMETKYGETMHLMEQTYREKLTGSRDCCDRALGVVKAGVALLQSELDERIRKDEEVRAELTAGACAQAFAFVEGVENDVATGDVSLATVEHLTALRAQAAASVSVLSERLGRSSPADTRNADHATAVLAALAEQVHHAHTTCTYNMHIHHAHTTCTYTTCTYNMPPPSLSTSLAFSLSLSLSRSLSPSLSRSLSLSRFLALSFHSLPPLTTPPSTPFSR